MNKNVIDSVAKQGFCIGCGMCAGICPNHNLRMDFDKLGEYKPIQIGECPDKCGICIHICPRATENEDEDENTLAQYRFGGIPGIHHNPATGYYLKSYTGFCRDDILRSKAASGGLTTLFLEQLLSDGEIDGVICVKPGSNPDKLFEFFIAKTLGELWLAAGSAYYPVEFSRIIRKILKDKGTYAIVGLPCFMTALSLAQQKIPKLEKRIKYKIGLVCGALPNKSYFEAIIRKMDIVKESVKIVKFRDKSVFPNRLKGIKILADDGNSYHTNNTLEGKVNRSSLFIPTACMFCDDVFAETADITFMDAWLPAHRTEHLGTTMVLVREPRSMKIIERIKSEGKADIKATDINHIMMSQKPRLTNKRDYLHYRLSLAERWQIAFPKKRKFSTRSLNYAERSKVKAKFFRHQKLRGLRLAPGEHLLTIPARILDLLLESRLILKDFVRKIYFDLHFRNN